MKHRGFTLIELLISVVVVGILMIAMSPVYTALASSSQRAYVETGKMVNQNIVSAILSYAANSTTLGTLPAPYTGSGYVSTVYNSGDTSPAGVALAQELSKAGLTPGSINDDGTAAANVRVYQLVSGLSQQVPLYFQSGPLVTLTYQYGAVYLTGCPKATASCNPSATGIPGESSLLTSGNYTTWSTSGTDLTPYIVSTLNLQKAMLITTVQRIDKVRDSLLSYFRSQQITAAAGDVTNWYPTSSSSLAGQTPGTNQGCRDGWYSLSGSTVLTNIGLASTEFGATAWGGDIQYCRDYDPTGTKTPDASPHYAALRINKSVSSGIAPSSSVLGNNVVLTF